MTESESRMFLLAGVVSVAGIAYWLVARSSDAAN